MVEISGQKTFEFLDLLNEMFVILNRDQTIEWVNKHATTILNDDRENIIGKNWFDHYLPKEIKTTVRQAFNLLINKETAATIEYYENPILTADGVEKIIKWHNSYIKNNNDDIVQIVSVGQDITKQKEIEKKIIQYEEFAKIMDSLPSIIYVIDPDSHKIIFANKTLKEIFKIPLEGQLCHEVLQGFDKPCDFCTSKFLVEHPNDPYVWEYYNEKVKAHFIITDRLIKWSDGRLLRFEHALDITEMKNASLKNQELIQRLEQSNSELEQFAYVASHDLQEPLRMISSYLQLINKRYYPLLDEDGKEFIKYAVEGSKRLKNQIQDLLIFSRITNQTEKMSLININTLLITVKDNLQKRIIETGSEIIYGNHPNIFCNSSQIIQLFQNLIENIIKFQKPNVSPKIEINFKEKENFWEFEVRDNGIGIESQYYEKIFTIFQRLHKKDEYEGNGIGLALCKRIITYHQGDIWIKSEKGSGSSFYFTIKKVIK